MPKLRRCINEYNICSILDCISGHIRLVNQTGREVEGRSGIVQLCWGSTWSTVCGFDGWSSHAANIVCEQLGYHKFCKTDKAVLTACIKFVFVCMQVPTKQPIIPQDALWRRIHKTQKLLV